MIRIPKLEELRGYSVSQLDTVASNLRTFLREAPNHKKGHLESSLAVTELTTALHYVLNTPDDVLIWDVGHQAYVHKVLTGRADEFHTNRKFGGLSGFPARAESEFDAFGTGHSSTSISAITGMALEDQRQGKSNAHVAVIGDGALTGGMAYEALNFLGTTDLNVLIILNDNAKAIDPNVGALSELDSYQGFFESLNLGYLGEFDGHDTKGLVEKLRVSVKAKGPRILRVKTKAESLPSEPKYHSELPFQDVFGEAIEELLERDERITVISPAMISGAGLKQTKKNYPDRIVDVGIAEQHAATLAAGIAASGGKPILHLYSTFAQRAYDQIIHDIALQNLPVIICLDRAGLVGEDGPTHHGAFDLAFLRPIPNLVISAPRNGIELRDMLYTAAQSEGPVVIRYPRDTEARFDAKGQFEAIPVGQSRWVREGEKLCIMSTGTMSRRAEKVATKLEQEGHKIGVLHHLFVKPIDRAKLAEAVDNYTDWIVLEDSVVGGIGTAILEWLGDQSFITTPRIHRLHLPDTFIPHGEVETLHAQLNMDEKSVYEQCLSLL